MAYQGGGGHTSRGGLNARPQVNPDQVQIRIEKFDYDQEVESLRSHVGRIKEMSLAIEGERKQQGELINSMEDAMEQAKMGLKRAMQRLNSAYKQAQSNHLLLLVIFAIVLLFGVYILLKFVRLGKSIFG